MRKEDDEDNDEKEGEETPQKKPWISQVKGEQAAVKVVPMQTYVTVEEDEDGER